MSAAERNERANEQKVAALERLLRSSDVDDASYRKQANDAATLLEQVAVVLRDPGTRDYMGGETDLPALLASVVKTPLPKDESTRTAFLELAGQAGRVAANLVAESDPNRDRLASAGYLAPTLALLSTRPMLPLTVVRPLVASLLNLSVDGHGSVAATLSTHDHLSAIMTLAGDVYVPGQTYADDDQDARAGLAQWLWTIADAVIPENTTPAYNLTAADVALFLLPLLCASPDAKETPEADFSTDITILTHATRVLERFNAADKLEHAAIMRSDPTIRGMLDFVEFGVIPPWAAVDDGDEPGSTDKALGVAKASVARTIVSLLAEAGDATPAWVWARVQSWLSLDDRSDLVACALLSYGNRARSDAASTALAAEPGFLPRLVALLTPRTPVIVQHALLGLLRNLSIPMANKPPLGDAGVIEGVVALDPWSQARDMVGSVQGGAIGVIKNLVRDPTSPENTLRFFAPDPDAAAPLDLDAAPVPLAQATIVEISSDAAAGPNDDNDVDSPAHTPAPGVEALHALIGRTNDAPLALEGTRVFGTAVRSLAATAPATPPGGLPQTPSPREERTRAAWTRLRDPRTLLLLARSLVAGEQYPALVTEGVVALSLLAAFSGSADTPAAIDAALMTTQATQADAAAAAQGLERAGQRRGADVLAGVLAPQRGTVVAPQAQQSALALVRLLPEGSGVRKVCKVAIEVAESEGRAVATPSGDLVARKSGGTDDASGGTATATTPAAQ